MIFAAEEPAFVRSATNHVGGRVSTPVEAERKLGKVSRSCVALCRMLLQSARLEAVPFPVLPKLLRRVKSADAIGTLRLRSVRAPRG
jgi:hypothetical protein